MNGGQAFQKWELVMRRNVNNTNVTTVDEIIVENLDAPVDVEIQVD